MQNWIELITSVLVFMQACVYLLGLHSAGGVTALSGGFGSTKCSFKTSELQHFLSAVCDHETLRILVDFFFSSCWR